MLQEASKLINNAFQQSFLKRLSNYLHDCIREEVKSSTFRNLKQDKDNKWVFLEEEAGLLITPNGPLKLDGTDNKLTELMINAETSQKDKYLIFGFLFLEGKSGKKKSVSEFLTPLLYIPCRLERSGTNLCCILTEESWSLNTGALAGLLEYEDEDQAENLFGGLIDVVPDFPVTNEKMQIFLTTLKSIIPEIDMSSCPQYVGKMNSDEESEIAVTNKSSVILTKRPSVTAGILHELTQMAEKPSGVFRETCLYPINEEYQGAKPKITNKSQDKEFFPITPLSLSDSQTEVLKSIEDHTLVTVYGPPGTGKSQTIVNLVCHLVANGKTVLVASRMDKAVDVVSERLNDFGAPYLAMRAGRANYQKQLNFELQDLLSNKIDFDNGFESAVFADIDDMKSLLKTKKELENKCEEIIRMEHKWFSALEEFKERSAELNNNLIDKKLSDLDIQLSKTILKKVENQLDKPGFINKILGWVYNFQLTKTLMIKNIDYSYENIQELKDEINVKELYNRLKTIESGINKVGNLHQLLIQIKDCQKKQRKLAIDILKNKRRKSLMEITKDQQKRQRLIVHSKTLIEKKKNLTSRVLEDEDFQPLLDAFPCWAVTTYAISDVLPLKPGLFDVAIIDEASQCDIASCFPVMYRAKKAIIVGDDKQLPHLSFLEKAKEQSFFTQHNISDKYQLMWRFRTNSMFDLANYYSTCPVLLDEHFRSLPPIIEFSNQEFYGGRLRIMNKETNLKDCLELIIVEDAKVDPETTKNLAETEKIMEKLQEIMMKDAEENPKKPSSIGIISPFRGQVEQIKKAISQVIPDSLVRKHEIEVGTAHTFQGDERDIMILSWTVAMNSHIQSLTFLQKPNLFNVAITRARKKLICFVSRPVESLPQGLLRSFLDYIREFKLKSEVNERLEVIANQYNNKLEKEIAQMCEEEGLKVKAGFETAGLLIDLVVSDDEHQLAIECDGQDDEIAKPVKQIWKQTILERCGWKVVRITAREWYYSPAACIDKIKRNLIEMKLS